MNHTAVLTIHKPLIHPLSGFIKLLFNKTKNNWQDAKNNNTKNHISKIIFNGRLIPKKNSPIAQMT